MEVTKKQAETLTASGVKCFCITTGAIDYAQNPILSEKYECTLCDYDLPKIEKCLLDEIFAKNANDGTISIMTFKTDYIGKYIHMARDEILNFELKAIIASDGIFKQLAKEKSDTEKITIKNAMHPRKLKKEILANAKKIGMIEKYISRYAV